MENVKKIIDLCEHYTDSECSLYEFQQRLQTLSMNEIPKEVQRLLYSVDNDLEEVRFCFKEDKYFKESLPIVRRLYETLIKL